MAKILAVDDEPAILEMIESILNKDGHLVTKVSNPLKINMEELHRYDLILLDIMMPGIDGFELCKRIRILVDCPILFLTAKTEENSLVNGLSLGADDYISKPFGVMELRARINAHLRREHREHSVRMLIRLIIQGRVKTQEKIGISSGTVLQVDGLYVFTSIPIVMVIIQRLIIITPLLQIGIWSYTM